MNPNLSLKQHCIETEIKKRYNSAISDYFKAGKDGAPHLEERIDLLHSALETLDFGRLRSRHPELRGNNDAAVSLFRDEAGRLRIAIDGETIEP